MFVVPLRVEDAQGLATIGRLPAPDGLAPDLPVVSIPSPRAPHKSRLRVLLHGRESVAPNTPLLDPADQL